MVYARLPYRLRQASVLFFFFVLGVVPGYLSAQTTTPVTHLSGYPAYCPNFVSSLRIGMRDTAPGGQVEELQKFLVDYYRLSPGTMITGFFGTLTQMAVMRLQTELGVPAGGVVEYLTQKAIAKVCGRVGTESLYAEFGISQALSPVSFRVNGSDTSVVIKDRDPVFISWTAPKMWKCSIRGVYEEASSQNTVIENLPVTGQRVVFAVIPPGSAVAPVVLQCFPPDGGVPVVQVSYFLAASAGLDEVPGAVNIKSFVVGPDPVLAGAPITASWTSAGADSCSLYATKVYGTYDSQVEIVNNLPTNGFQEVTHAELLTATKNTANDPVVLTLTCSNQTGAQASRGWYSSIARVEELAAVVSASPATATSASSPSTAYQPVTGAPTDGQPYADLKINGSDGPVTLKDNEPITVSWTSYPGLVCYLHRVKETVGGAPYLYGQPASDSRTLYASQSLMGLFSILLTCHNALGNPNLDFLKALTDSVAVFPPGYVPAPAIDPDSASTTYTTDLKINGSDGPVALKNNEPITVSWTSAPGSLCMILGVRETPNSSTANVLGQNSSGTRLLYAYTLVGRPLTAMLRCQKAYPDSPHHDGVYVKPFGYVEPVLTKPSVTSFEVTPYVVQVGGTLTASWNSVNAKSCTLYVVHREATTSRTVVFAEYLPANATRSISQEDLTRVARNTISDPISLVLECRGDAGVTDSAVAYNMIAGAGNTTTDATSTVSYYQSAYFTSSAYGSSTTSIATSTSYAQSSTPVATTSTATSSGIFYSQATYVSTPAVYVPTVYATSFATTSQAANSAIGGNVNGVRVNTLTTTPSPLPQGGTITVSWTSSNANSCSLYAGSGLRGRVLLEKNVEGNGSRSFTHAAMMEATQDSEYMPIIFVVECTGASRSIHSRVLATDMVRPVVSYSQAAYSSTAPTYAQAAYSAGGGSSNVVHVDTLTTSPSPLVEGGTLTVSWTSTNATACTLYASSNSQDSARVVLAPNIALSGSLSFTHAAIMAVTHDPAIIPIILVVECTGESRSVESKVVSTLTSPVPVVTPAYAIDLKINSSDGPLTLTNLEPITVSWTSSGMTSCLIVGAYSSIGGSVGAPGLATTGSRAMYAQVSNSQPISVLLRCSKTTGGVMDDTVVVNQSVPPGYGQASYYSQSSYGGDGGGDGGGAMIPTSASRNLASSASIPGIYDRYSDLLAKIMSLMRR